MGNGKKKADLFPLIKPVKGLILLFLFFTGLLEKTAGFRGFLKL